MDYEVSNISTEHFKVNKNNFIIYAFIAVCGNDVIEKWDELQTLPLKSRRYKKIVEEFKKKKYSFITVDSKKLDTKIEATQVINDDRCVFFNLKNWKRFSGDKHIDEHLSYL